MLAGASLKVHSFLIDFSIRGSMSEDIKSHHEEPDVEFQLVPSEFTSRVEGRKQAMDLLKDQMEELERKLTSVKSQLNAEQHMLVDVLIEAFPDHKLAKKHWHLIEREGSLGVCIHHKVSNGPRIVMGSLNDLLRMLGGSDEQPSQDEPPVEGGSHLD